MKSRLLLTAAVLTTMAGGVCDVLAADITRDTTLTNTELTDAEYKGTGAGSSLTVTVDGNTDSQSLILAQGGTQKTFSDLDSFSIHNSENLSTHTQSGVINATSGSTISFENVKNIQLGSADAALQNSNPVIHGFSGNIAITGTDQLSIYSESNAVQAQQSGNNQAGSVAIDAQNIDIHTTGAIAVLSAAYGPVSKDKGTSLDMHAGDSIYIESKNTENNVASALQILSNYQGKNYTGTANMNVTAENDITLIGTNEEGTNAYGVSVFRSGESGNSALNIMSKNGKVQIVGDQVGVFTQASNDANVTGTIQGKEVDISSDSYGIIIDKTNGFSVTGDLIHISGGTNAVRVRNGSEVTLAGIDKESTIILDSTDTGYAINVMNSDSQLNIGNGQTKTDVYVNGYMSVTDGANATFEKNTTTHVDSKYLPCGQQVSGK